MIGHLEALPEPTQIALGLPLFKIGDEHFHWRADQIKSWHKERCRSLRQQLSELQREQWQSPVGAPPWRFGANILERLRTAILKWIALTLSPSWKQAKCPNRLRNALAG